MWLVTDPIKKKHVLALINHVYHINHATPHVPVDNPVSIDRSGLDALKRENYIVAYKADGTRYLLVLTLYAGRPLAVLVNRAGHVYSLHVQAQWGHYHKNSIFDGELCPIDKSIQHFVIFNALQDQGQSLVDLPYPQRLQHIQSNFAAQPLTTEERRNVTSFIVPLVPQMHFICKEWDFAQNMRSMIRNVIPQYATDGFILTPVDKPVVTGRNSDMFKWKKEHPIDVRATIKDAQLLLEIDDNGTPVPLHRVMPHVSFNDDDDLWQQLLAGWELYNEIVSNGTGTFHHVVEMYCRPTANNHFQLQFMRLRPDKEGPNNVQTIFRTLQSISDGITQEDLFGAVARI